MITKTKDAHKRLEHIFKDLLPKHGMPERAEQIQLSHQILDAMFDKRLHYVMQELELEKLTHI